MVSIFQRKYIFLILLSFQSVISYSQVTAGSNYPPAEGAVLDIKTEDGNNPVSSWGGLLLPRVSLSTITSLHPFMDTLAADYTQGIKSLHTGLIVYNTKTDGVKKLTPGIYRWDGSKWIKQTPDNGGSSDPWFEVGAGIPATDNTKDAYLSAPAVVGGTAIVNINNGDKASLTVTGGDANINGITVGKGKASRDNNTALGTEALGANTSGDTNTAIGYNALIANTSGSGNTAIGYMSLSGLTTGSNNVGIGSNAGNTLTSGNYNIMIGNGVSPAINTGNNQINIGNAIFGTTGVSLSQVGKISIGRNFAPASNLHVEGNMILEKADAITEGEALLIDTNGKVGIGALLPTPTPHTFCQSETTHIFNQTAMNAFNNASSGYVVTWNGTDMLSNNMTTFNSGDMSFTFNNDYTCKISGYVGFQFMGNNAAYPATSYTNMINLPSGLTAAVLEIQEATGSSGWTTIATGYQVWYGAAIIATVKVIQVPPTVIKIRNGSRIRMLLKKAAIGNPTYIDSDDASIMKPAGARYSKGLAIVALAP